MKKTLSITLLMLSSGLTAKETTPQDLLPDTKELITTAPVQKTPTSVAKDSKTPSHRPSAFIKSVENAFDRLEKEMAESFTEIAKEAGHTWDAAQAKALNVKNALHNKTCNFSMEDEAEQVLIKIHISEFSPAPDRDLHFEIENDPTNKSGAFHVKLTHSDSAQSLTVAGSFNHNLLTAQVITKEERISKNGSPELATVQDSVIQRAVVGELELDKLTADFTKANKTLTISIPKKAAPEKKVRKVAVTIK
jgi:hypothetical protein